MIFLLKSKLDYFFDKDHLAAPDLKLHHFYFHGNHTHDGTPELASQRKGQRTQRMQSSE